MAKATTSSKQSKKTTTKDCHCNEPKSTTKSKSTKSSKVCDCLESK